jgi:Restriction endonuclease
MSEDNRPVFPTDDMAISALIKHWKVRNTSYLPAPEPAHYTITGVPFSLPATPQILGVTLIPEKFILPIPPIAVVSAWQSLAEQIATGSRLLDELHWTEFEDLMAEILETSGWSITPMGYTKDGGVDIIAVRHVQPGVPIEMLVQCKRFKKTRRVDVEIVQQVWATKFEQSFHQAMIAATSSFTLGAQQKAKIWKMDLRDYDHILE